MTGRQASLQWAPTALPRQRIMRSLRLSLLASSLLAAGCTTMMGPGPGGQAQTGPAGAPATPPAVAKVGVLLPLSGPNGGLGENMLRASKLALSSPTGPIVDAHDTAGPGGAVAAAQAAIGNGDTLLLGPLTSGDTGAVAPVAHAANVPVLAFTSDVGQSQPGVWVMGVTPEQQVRRLVFAAKAEGRSRFAALLPSGPLGAALAEGLTRACADAGLSAPTILTHAGTADSITSTMKQLTDFAARQASVPAPSGAPAAAPQAATPSAQPAAPVAAPVAAPAPVAVAAAAQAPAATPAAVPVPKLPPPPFDALLLGDTGLQLQQVIVALQATQVDPAQVRIMGPTLWGAFASKLHALAGAWYAAPDPAARLGFVQQYQAAYHQSPKLLADYAYDSAALARSLAPTGYTADALERPDGFAGVDGVFMLRADGHVQRAMAIFQVQPGGGARIVQPAPQSLITSGS